MPSRAILLLVILVGSTCSDSDPPKQNRDRSGQPVPDTYVYSDISGTRPDGLLVVDLPKGTAKDTKASPDVKAPVDKRPPDTKPPVDKRPPDTKAPPDLNCIPSGGDKCTQTPNNCCGGLSCCTCTCGNFCKWSATISCQNVCINVC